MRPPGSRAGYAHERHPRPRRAFETSSDDSIPADPDALCGHLSAGGSGDPTTACWRSPATTVPRSWPSSVPGTIQQEKDDPSVSAEVVRPGMLSLGLNALIQWGRQEGLSRVLFMALRAVACTAYTPAPVAARRHSAPRLRSVILDRPTREIVELKGRMVTQNLLLRCAISAAGDRRLAVATPTVHKAAGGRIGQAVLRTKSSGAPARFVPRVVAALAAAPRRPIFSGYNSGDILN